MITLKSSVFLSESVTTLTSFTKNLKHTRNTKHIPCCRTFYGDRMENVWKTAKTEGSVRGACVCACCKGQCGNDALHVWFGHYYYLL